MFKIGKTIDIESNVEVFVNNVESYHYDTVLNKGVLNKEYKEISFKITGSLDNKVYNLEFKFNKPIDDLLTLEKYQKYNINDFLYPHDAFLEISGVYYDIDIYGCLLRFNENNKFILELTFMSTDYNYFGALEFDFLLDDYLNK